MSFCHFKLLVSACMLQKLLSFFLSPYSSSLFTEDFAACFEKNVDNGSQSLFAHFPCLHPLLFTLTLPQKLFSACIKSARKPTGWPTVVIV